MKKLQKTLPALMFILAFSLTSLSGCQNNPPEQGNGIDQTPLDRRIGVIQSLGGATTNSQGTDILTMDDGTTILLKSLQINLDDPKYLGKKVELSGVLTYTTDNKQIMEVQSIDVLEDVAAAPATQQQAPTWQDYVNAALGFQVKYRNDFTVAENGQTITFTRPVSPDAFIAGSSQEAAAPSTMQMTQDHVITVMVTPHSAGADLVKDFLKLPDDKAGTLMGAEYNKSRIGANGIDAYKHVALNNVTFSFDDGSNFYQISYMSGNDSQAIEDQNNFYDFLASFQLLNGPSVTQQAIITPVANPVPLPAPTPTPAPVTTSSTQSDFNISNSNPVPAPINTITIPPASSDSSGSATTGTSNSSVSPGTTQELLPGFSSFSSSAYKFNLQYPKGWYYGQTTSTDSSVIRRYDFGSKPVDQQPGTVNLDVVSGGIPSGTTTTVGDKMLVMTSNSDGTISYYYKGQSGRVYRMSGPSNMDIVFKNMFETLQEQ